MEEVKKKLRARARVKYLQSNVLGSLIDLDNERKSHYLKATACCRGGVISEGKLTMRYCKSRVCQLCNRNRSGRLINAYSEQLKGRRYKFITLTLPNCKGEELKRTIEEMKIVFLYVRRKFARENRVINGLYTIETTYNWKSNTYHPHIHSLIDLDVVESFELTKQWIAAWEKRGIRCSSQAQNIKQADERAISEVFKYAIKFDTTVVNDNGKTVLKYSAHAIDTMVEAVWGKRMVITFGDIRALDEEYQEEAVIKWEADYDVYLWSICDWYSITTGEALSGYTPSELPKARRRRRGPTEWGEAASVSRRLILEEN